MQNLDNGIIGLQCLCFVPVGALIKYHWHATVMYVGYRGTSLCLDPGVWVAGGDLCGKAATPIDGLRAASPIGSRVKRLAQGELMPCVNSYWVLPDAEIRRFGSFAAASPSGKISRDLRNEN